MPQEKIVHGHEIIDRVLFIDLSLTALVITGIGALIFLVTFFILFS